MIKTYTPYEIEKLTEGKYTRYKLTQAIQKGELKADRNTSESQAGQANYNISENDLKRYIIEQEKEKHKRIQSLKDEEKKQKNEKESDKIPNFYDRKDIELLIKQTTDKFEAKIKELDQKIKAIETVNDALKEEQQQIEKEAIYQEKKRADIKIDKEDLLKTYHKTFFLNFKKKKQLLTELIMIDQ